MPPRVRLLLTVAFMAVGGAGVAAAQGQEPSSSYRLRSDHGQNKLLEVPTPQEERAGPTASLNDEVPASSSESNRVARASLTGHTDERNSTPAGPAAKEKPPLKLAPRSETGGRQLAKPAATSATGAVGSVVGSLTAVLGLFVAVVWLTRRLGPAGSAPLPKEAVELLGRTTVSGQHALQLVRVGGRLLLVALSPHGAATLTEIIDPAEVERLTAICLRQRPGSASASFQQTISQLEREPASRSFVEERRPTSAAGARSRTSRA